MNYVVKRGAITKKFPLNCDTNFTTSSDVGLQKRAT